MEGTTKGMKMEERKLRKDRMRERKKCRWKKNEK